MIISHEHKFIFIKTNKTAGTSVEIALSKFLGPNDIVTKISPIDEETRNALGYPGARNYLAKRASAQKWMDTVLGRPEKVVFFNHMSATHIRELIPKDIWNGYFKFCVERNPWDRAVSSYFWRNKSEPRQPMIDWLKKGGHKNLQKRGRDLYSIDGIIVVDQVVKFEDLTADLETVRTKLGLPEPLELPNAKSSSRKDKRHYREILSEEEKKIISKSFAFEIRTFGYEF